MDRKHVYLIVWPFQVVCHCFRAIYKYTSITFKHRLRLGLVNHNQTSYEATLQRQNDLYINDPGHMTKIATRAIISKFLLIFSSRNPEGMCI